MHKLFSDCAREMSREAAAITKDSLAVRIDKQTGQVLIYPMEDFRKVVEGNMIAPIYWAIELVAAVAKDRASRGLKRWQPEKECKEQSCSWDRLPQWVMSDKSPTPRPKQAWKELLPLSWPSRCITGSAAA
jgi:hypothetical protein